MLLGHGDRGQENEGWTGNRGNGVFNGRRADQVHGENVDESGVPQRYLIGSKGYEAMD